MKKFIYLLLPFVAQFGSCVSQERRFFANELAQIPENIIKCYTDRVLWDRFNRLPYNVDSLIAIIRKIELHPDVSLVR